MTTHETKNVYVESLDDVIESLEDESKNIFTITSNDGTELSILMKDARLSKIIKTVIDDSASMEITLDLSSKNLKYFVEYATHHSDKYPQIIPKPILSNVMSDMCDDPWDAIFIDSVAENLHDLYSLAFASNYIVCKPLLHLVTAKIAALLKNRSVEDVKTILSGTWVPEEENVF